MPIQLVTDLIAIPGKSTQEGRVVEFLRRQLKQAGVPDAHVTIDINNSQVLRFRTFSKAYGLAGARIGYALGEANLIQVFEKIRNHYGINRVGQIGALAALADQDHLRETVVRIARARTQIARIAELHGLSPIASAANFVAIDCNRDASFASRVMSNLLARGVFVRKPAVAPLDRCIRVSTGPDDELAVFAEVLPTALAAASASG